MGFGDSSAPRSAAMGGGEGPVEGGPPAKLRRAAPEEGSRAVAEAVQRLLRAGGDCRSSFAEGAPERLSAQTGQMRSLFLRFPQSLLLHRLRSPPERPLYAFLAESREREGRLVHVALLRDGAPEQLRQMLRSFQELNPEWRRVKVVFVDAAFGHHSLLRSSFPSAQVLLSVYHAVRLLEGLLRESGASASSKEALREALREAAFSPSGAGLESLSRQVRELRLVGPELHDHLHRHWFSCEMLRYAHAKKGLHSCSAYFDSLDLLTQSLDGLLRSQPSLERGVAALLEHADRFNTKQGLLRLTRSVSHEEHLRWRSPAEGRRSGTRQALSRAPSKGATSMLSALKESCTDLAFRLCLTEWEAVQSSGRVVKSARGRTTVQLLEEEYEVGTDGLSCGCSFRRLHRLPCRHLLAMLLETGRALSEAMVGRRWQKKYLHLLGSAGRSAGTPEAEALGAAPEERREKIQSLSRELSHLLLQSEGRECEERLSTLQMIVTIWDGGCEPRGGEGGDGLGLRRPSRRRGRTAHGFGSASENLSVAAGL